MAITVPSVVGRQPAGRTATRKLAKGRERLVSPQGWPTAVERENSWTGSTFQQDAEFTHVLTENNILEIEETLAAFKGETTLKLVTLLKPTTQGSA